MQKVNKKPTTNTAKTPSDIVKTPYWLNMKGTIGNIGIQLAQGIDSHEPYLELLQAVGVQDANEYLAEHDPHLYLVESGKPTKNNSVKNIIANIQAKKKDIS